MRGNFTSERGCVLDLSNLKLKGIIERLHLTPIATNFSLLTFENLQIKWHSSFCKDDNFSRGKTLSTDFLSRKGVKGSFIMRNLLKRGGTNSKYSEPHLAFNAQQEVLFSRSNPNNSP